MRKLVLLSLSLSLCTFVAACGVEDPAAAATEAEDVAHAEQELIGGQVVPNHWAPEIGAIFRNGRLWCTGTLVSPNVVLAAAHCFDFHNGPTNQYTVQFWGPSSAFATRGDEVRSFARADQVLLPSGAVVANGPGFADIALLRLAARVPEHVAVGRPMDPTDHIGASLTVVGFGCNRSDDTGWGVKRASFGTLTAYGPLFPTAELCPRDSGGPVIVNGTGKIYGVNSWAYWNNWRWDASGFAVVKSVWEPLQLALFLMTIAGP